MNQEGKTSLRRIGERRRNSKNSPQQHEKDVKMISLKLDELNPHLVCRICQGYYRDAHTIMECLHTFCKSCLLEEFYRGLRSCPHCAVELGPHPLHGILYDRTMQELVNKILPDLDEEDKIKEEAFYLKRGIKRKSDDSPIDKPNSGASSSSSSSSSRTYRTTAPPSSLSSAVPESTIEETVSNDNDMNIDPAEAEIFFEISPAPPTTNYPNKMAIMDKPFLKTSGKLKIIQLKKYISMSNGSSIDDLEILCNGELLGAELSIYFIKCTRWVVSEAKDHLHLHYRQKI